MKRLLLLSLLIAAAWFLPDRAAAADTVTSGTLTRTDYKAAGIHVVTLAWTSDSAGRVTATLREIEGTILRITINPGSTAPTDDYDMTLTDEDAVDMLGGYGANLDTATTTNFLPFVTNIGSALSYVPMVTQGELSWAITNAGSAKVGTVKIFLRPTF